ncbi:hypothetical protein ACIL2V_002727 [Vibrio alginolyticus]
MEELNSKKSFDTLLVAIKEARSLIMAGTYNETEHDYRYNIDQFLQDCAKQLLKVGRGRKVSLEDFHRASVLIEEARGLYPTGEGVFVSMECYTKISEAIKVLHKIDEVWDADLRADLEERRLGILEGIDFDGVYIFDSKKDGIEYVPTDMPDESHVEFTSKDGEVSLKVHWTEIEKGSWVQIK